MKIRKVWAVYCSPTGDTGKIVSRMAATLAESLGAELGSYDFTLPAARVNKQSYGEGELVVFGTPVYASRVPNKFLPAVQENFSGEGALAVPVVSFGNRSFGDALSELRIELEKNGFRVVAGAAVVAEHKMVSGIADGRPDGEDIARVDRLCAELAEKLKKAESLPESVAVKGADPVGPYYTPLGRDGQPAKFLKAKPKTDMSLCNGCGACAAVCPMGSISAEEPGKAEGVCIKCQACVRACPVSAKYFDDEAMLSHIDMLKEYVTWRSETEYFI